VIKIDQSDPSQNTKSGTGRINDRGAKQADRILDVTRVAASRLGTLKGGGAGVELKEVGTAKGKAVKKRAKKA
jgi:rare lipoprotein A (peptidoglycan hydrolase)